MSLNCLRDFLFQYRLCRDSVFFDHACFSSHYHSMLPLLLGICYSFMEDMLAENVPITNETKTYKKDVDYLFQVPEGIMIFFLVHPGETAIIELGDVNTSYTYTTVYDEFWLFSRSGLEYGRNVSLTLNQDRNITTFAMHEICDQFYAFRQGVKTKLTATSRDCKSLCLITLDDNINISWDSNMSGFVVDNQENIECPERCVYDHLPAWSVIVPNISELKYGEIVIDGDGRDTAPYRVDGVLWTNKVLPWDLCASAAEPEVEEPHDDGLAPAVIAGITAPLVIIAVASIALSILCCVIHPFPLCCGCACCCRPLKSQLPDPVEQMAPPLDL